MSQPKEYLIGIDPSFETCGVAVYCPATCSLALHPGDFFSAMAFLNKSRLLGKSVVVLENPNLDSNMFGMWGMFQVTLNSLLQKRPMKDGRIAGIGDLRSSFSIALKYAEGVGKNKAAANLFLEMFTRAGIPVIQIKPSDRDRADKIKAPSIGVKVLSIPTKTTANQFLQLTGYDGRSNEHTRDAATMIHGRTMKWAEIMLLRQQQ